MSGESYQPKKIFTVQEANSILPLVRAITKDLVNLSREVTERRERVWASYGNRTGKQRDIYREELAQIEEELEKDTARLYEFVEELRDLGVEPKNGPEGLIDFPAMIDGRLVFLCWKFGEPEVLYWHDLDAGFRGRQSLVAGSIAGIDDEPDDSAESS
jgi:hypothetical protein